VILLFIIFSFYFGGPVALGSDATPPTPNPDTNTQNCGRSFSHLVKSFTSGVSLGMGTGTRKLSPDAFSLFEKVRLNSDVSLSTEELARLKQENLIPLLENYQASSQWVKDFNHWRALSARSQPQLRFRDHWGRTTLDFANMMFAPGLPIGPQEKLRLIFAKVARDSNFSPSIAERDFLKRWRMEGDFERFRIESAQNPAPFLFLTSVRQSANQLRWGLIGTGVAGFTLAPELVGKRVTLEEDERLRADSRANPNSLIRLYYSENDDLPPVIRIGRSAFVFEMGEVKFLNEKGLKEFEQSLRTRAIPYTRVELQASAENRATLRRELVEYVSRRRSVDASANSTAQEFVNVHYLDLPMGELYKLVQRHLGLPPLPIVSRNNAVVTTALGIAAQIGGTGAVREIYRVEESDKTRNALDLANRGFNNYLNSILLTTPSAAFPIGGGLWYWDSRPHNRIQSVHPMASPPTPSPSPQRQPPLPTAQPVSPEPVGH
jgi:hypothetical protein